MASLIGTFAPVADFSQLAPLSLKDLTQQTALVRSELLAFETWLGSPPADATAAEIWRHISLWDGCSQWLHAYEQRLEIVSLREELAEVRGLLRTLEGEEHRSHDEMAAADAYWDELDRRENRILQRLEALGAAESEPAPPAPAPVSPEKDTRSWIQRQLDEEWESANFKGPGCPFCDALLGCDCWSRRSEMIEAEERRKEREERARVAARVASGEDDCQCDDYGQCEACREEEKARCGACGGLQCKPDCCGECRNCDRCSSRCPRCKEFGDCGCYEDDQDGVSSCGCGACEELYGRDGGYESDF